MSADRTDAVIADAEKYIERLPGQARLIVNSLLAECARLRTEQEALEKRLDDVACTLFAHWDNPLPSNLAILQAFVARQTGVTVAELRAKSEAATDAAARQISALRAFVQQTADRKLCAEEPEKCYDDSGPYCGTHHGFLGDDEILEARKLLAPPQQD